MFGGMVFKYFKDFNVWFLEECKYLCFEYISNWVSFVIIKRSDVNLGLIVGLLIFLCF